MPTSRRRHLLPASAYLRRQLCLTGLTLGALAPAELRAQSAAIPSSRRLSAADLDTMALRDPGVRVAYGADPRQYGELRLPPGLMPGVRAPVAIVVHGGCWIAGFASLRNTAALADALAAMGVATWNIEYRRGDQPGGGWPGTFGDVAEATDHLRTLATRFPLDTARIVAVGHSAGGQLALWLASRRTLSPSSPLFRERPLGLQGVVSLGGVTDLDEFARRAATGCGRGVTGLLGGAPATVPERVAEASPIRRLPLGIATMHIAGAQDAIAPDSVREAYRDAARRAGDVPPSNQTVPGGHFEVIAPRTPAGEAVLRAVRALLGMAAAPPDTPRGNAP